VSLYTRFVRPALFRVDPERIHDRAIAAAETASSAEWFCSLLRQRLTFDDSALACEVAGIHFRHPVGLAAGFDKSGRGIPVWESFGFSHVEIGSVSAQFSAGHPKPRLFRLPEDRAIVVNYGLPNDGAERVAQRLAQLQPTRPLGVNLVNTNHGPGAPAASDDAIVADYIASIRALEPHASYLSLNLSCPNTCDGRAFVSDTGRVRLLLDAVAAEQPEKPIFLKVAPFADSASLDAFLQAVSGYAFVSGFAVNLPPGKPPGMLASPERLSSMPGAVSGKPCEAAANRTIESLYCRLDPGRYQIIGAGGVFTADDAWRKMQLGASLVQCLTALIYEGPLVVMDICQGLARIARREGLRNLQEAVGSAAGKRAHRVSADRDLNSLQARG
jgi:dihydroorotate dehydrogenase (fumarate)/dihydroorotate dehydrogenase